MNLAEIIINYRNEHSLSQRQFAAQCGLSNGYISMLEKGLNPKTKTPITPTLPILRKIAHGIGVSIDELLTVADDLDIDISKAAPAVSGERRELIELIPYLPDDVVHALLVLARQEGQRK